MAIERFETEYETVDLNEHQIIAITTNDGEGGIPHNPKHYKIITESYQFETTDEELVNRLIDQA